MIQGNKGFTILELLIGVLLSGIVVSAALSLYVTGHKQMMVQDDVANLQASARSSAEMMARTIRMAGNNVPVSLNSIETYNTNPDTIVITYDSEDLKDVTIEQDMPDEASPIRCDGHDLNKLSAGDWIYIFDPTTLSGEFCAVSDIDRENAVILHTTMPLSKPYQVGSKVLKLNRSKFYVDQSDSTQSNLMTQQIGHGPEVFAENISNLNFRYFLSWGAVVDQTETPAFIHMVEIGITARSPKPDEAFNNFHRVRSTTFRVKVRNL
jgi:prepilin-type N-terminal cleavage/methylation domain-containing protein